MDTDLFLDALGPLWSNSGTKTWSLLLAPDRIIAWPYTLPASSLSELIEPRPAFYLDFRAPCCNDRLIVSHGLVKGGGCHEADHHP